MLLIGKKSGAGLLSGLLYDHDDERIGLRVIEMLLGINFVKQVFNESF
jgi:hypothetical protein